MVYIIVYILIYLSYIGVTQCVAMKCDQLHTEIVGQLRRVVAQLT